MWTAENDLDDRELPDDFDDDSEVETIPCPECGAEVYEEAEQCPSCGTYLIPDTNPLRGGSTAWLILGMIGVAAVIVALLLG